MIINDNNRIMLGGGALPPLHPPCWPAVGRRENIGSGGLLPTLVVSCVVSQNPPASVESLERFAIRSLNL